MNFELEHELELAVPALPAKFVLSALGAVTLVPALAARFWRPAFCVLHRHADPVRPRKVQAQWQQSCRSLVHAVMLVGMLTGSASTAHCLVLTVMYLICDLAAAFWESEGDLGAENLIHHGTAVLSGCMVLLVPGAYATAHELARTFLWMELSTIFLNLFHLSKSSDMSQGVVSVFKNLFAFTFIVVRLVRTPMALMAWSNGPSAPWKRLPLLVRLCVWVLMLLQWYWCALLTCCVRRKRQ